MTLSSKLDRMWQVSAAKIRSIEATEFDGAPVFTHEGRYTSRGWTDWTQGFRVGSALLQFDATGDRTFLDLGRANTVKLMAPHVSHIGVHDHGFNNVSTYGNLLRLASDPWERRFCALALKTSGAVQAARWSRTDDGRGYIYSFNGPHSLFADTIRSLRVLALAHQLGHALMGERDRRISLLDRLTDHALVTLEHNVYYGRGRDIYDVRGRVAHESIFNPNDGSYRCPSTQQGYSPFSTWTRGLAWVLLGTAELLEWVAAQPEWPARARLVAALEEGARATADHYIDGATAADGIPYWDTGAPGLAKLDLGRPADPFNPHEPVDSSAAAIAAQGLLRLGRLDPRYKKAGEKVAAVLLDEPYLSTDERHQGLLLHSVYHRPNGWNGESSMWGDYHLRELALTLQKPGYTFFAGIEDAP